MKGLLLALRPAPGSNPRSPVQGPALTAVRLSLFLRTQPFWPSSDWRACTRPPAVPHWREAGSGCSVEVEPGSTDWRPGLVGQCPGSAGRRLTDPGKFTPSPVARAETSL